MTSKSDNVETTASTPSTTTTTTAATVSSTTTAVKTGSEEVLKKVVVRRLPPTLTKEQFLEQVSPIPPYDYFSYCKADLSLGANAFCRAYISFMSADDVFIFKEKFDNYVFVDAKSNEYPAIVEFAPFQRKLRNINTGVKSEKKADNKCNTIEQDQDYLKFVENMDKQGGEQLPSCEVILEQIEQKEKELSSAAGSKMTTPLLEFLKKKKEDRKSNRDKDRDIKRKKEDDRKRRKDDDKRKHDSKSKESEHQQYKILAKPQSASQSTSEKASGSKQSSGSSQNQRYGSASSSSNQSKSFSNKDSKSGKSSSNKASTPSTQSAVSLADSSKSSISEKKLKETPASSTTSLASQQTPTSEQSSSIASGSADKKDNKSKRPTMEIYNPAARAALRRQQSKPS